MSREAERKRLVELLQNFADGTYTNNGVIVDGTKVDDIADHLFANVIVVPPVKVGDKLYTTYCYGINDWRIEESIVYEVSQRIGVELEIIEMRRSKNGTFSYFKVELDKFGKTVFLAREEAEKALEGRGEK